MENKKCPECGEELGGHDITTDRRWCNKCKAWWMRNPIKKERENDTSRKIIFISTTLLMLLIAACGDVDIAGPETDYTRLLVCFPPDTIWVTVNGQLTFMLHSNREPPCPSE